jgi:hypothetical protein
MIGEAGSSEPVVCSNCSERVDLAFESDYKTSSYSPNESLSMRPGLRSRVQLSAQTVLAVQPPSNKAEDFSSSVNRSKNTTQSNVARTKAEQHLERFKTLHLAPQKPGETLPKGDLTREEIAHAHEIQIVEISRGQAIEADLRGGRQS